MRSHTNFHGLFHPMQTVSPGIDQQDSENEFWQPKSFEALVAEQAAISPTAGREMMGDRDHRLHGQFPATPTISPGIDQEESENEFWPYLISSEALELIHETNLHQQCLGSSLNNGQALPNICETDAHARTNGNRTSRSVGRPKSIGPHRIRTDQRLKASSIPVFQASIGSWKKRKIYDGDLVAKFYYKSHKIIVEMLDRESLLKHKMEMTWNNIIGIRAETQENKLGVLEIELNAQPTFYKELQPQPGKQSRWVEAADFTNGQALNHRRHCLEFHPGDLNKPFETLLRNDGKLKMLSQQKFPTSNNPFFGKKNFSLPPEFTVGIDKGLQTQPDSCGFGLPYASNTKNFVAAQKNFNMQEPMYHSSDLSLHNHALTPAHQISQAPSTPAHGAAPQHTGNHLESTIVPIDPVSGLQKVMAYQEPSIPTDLASAHEFLCSGNAVIPFPKI